jgi:anaerobic magnesium-protoporphyrin IX monomethyl ester cyclase
VGVISHPEMSGRELIQLQSPLVEPRSLAPDKGSVVLIGFQEQGNLGLGYLSSVLRVNGYRPVIQDFENDPAEILLAVERARPHLVGFSMIFQYYIHRFRQLARYLRDHSIEAHFSMGGHFPSLSYEETLRLVPELDSVVRFEGELTLIDLVDRIRANENWRATIGIAYRDGDRMVANELRPLIPDLDSLPYPDRTYEPERILGRAAMPLLASRGCSRTCSFCSIHTFYRSTRGRVVRTRRPANIVREMEELHEDRGVSIFLFQDDDFPIFGPVWHRWVYDFLDEIRRSPLHGRVIWKINCRADSVEPELFAAMRDAGLYLTYMGLESGSEEGLETLNKDITVEQNVRAVAILKQIGLTFDFGFMLLDPSSTFESVLANVRFLRQIVGDGTAPAVFCKMLPYDGTPIKKALQAAGRLIGDVCNPDYKFLDPRLTDFYSELSTMVSGAGWIHGHGALSQELKWAWTEVAVLGRLFPTLEGMADYTSRLRAITMSSNAALFELVEKLARAYQETSSSGAVTPRNLGRSVGVSPSDIASQRLKFHDVLLEARNEFVFSNQQALVESLQVGSRTSEIA